jgi:hypothetical protein
VRDLAPPAFRGELRAAYNVWAAHPRQYQLAETMSYAPDRGGGAGAQQPGSPGCPQHVERMRRRRSMFAVQRSAFQRAEPGWVIFRHQAGRLWAERGTSTLSSWPLPWLDEHTSVAILPWPYDLLLGTHRLRLTVAYAPMMSQCHASNCPRLVIKQSSFCHGAVMSIAYSGHVVMSGGTSAPAGRSVSPTSSPLLSSLPSDDSQNPQGAKT